METILLVFHLCICFFLIGVILLQAGKGADIGAAFGAGGSQTVFGPRGAATFLSKMTTVVALLFLATSITLARIARERSTSVLESAPPISAPAPVVEPPLTTPDTQK